MRRVAAEVHLEFLVGDFDVHMNRQGAAVASAFIKKIFASKSAFGQFLEALAGNLFSGIDDMSEGVEVGFDPVFADERPNALVGDPHARDLCFQVADRGIRQSGIDPDDVDHRRVDFPSLVELAERDLQAFLVNLGSSGPPASEAHSPDVVPMALARGESHESTLVKHGHDDADIVEVGA